MEMAYQVERKMGRSKFFWLFGIMGPFLTKLILKKLLGNGLKIGDHVVRLEKTVLWSELGGVGGFSCRNRRNSRSLWNFFSTRFGYARSRNMGDVEPYCKHLEGALLKLNARVSETYHKV
jgi:hypothetical protein